jgi:peptidoglycan/xylan/chitin deacetylase (PgdA/CDA1 family)
MQKKSTFIVLLILLFGLSISKTFPQNIKNKITGKGLTLQSVGQVTVKTWADNKKSAYSITLDDGLMSQYTYALPILDQHGLKASFFLIGDALTDGPPAIYRYGYWSQFQQIAAEGHEVGAHTMTHTDLTTLSLGDTSTPKTITYELEKSKSLVEQKIPGQKCISLAYPYCSFNSTVENVAANYFQVARTCGGYSENSNITGLNWYSVLSANLAFDEPRKTDADDQDEFNNYVNILQSTSIPNGNWAVLLAHEVVPMSEIAAGGDTTMWYPLSTDWFSQLCDWLKHKSDSNQIWVETFGNVTRYIKERENFTYSLVSSTASQIQINPADGLDDTIYNYPLTVDIVVPSNWNNVNVQQGNNNSVVSAFSDGTNTLVRVHVVPDGGVLTLTPSSTSAFQISGIVTYENTAQSPLANVIVTLKSGSDSITSVTDVNGNFSFSNVVPGTYSLSAGKTTGWGGVNTTDALLTAKYFTKSATLDDLQKLAADVNNDGQVNSTDALLIARRFAKLINSFAKPDWVFSLPVSVTVTSSNVIQNLKGLATGDVNESLVPTPGL